jgi:geranylgeranyl pyrophosphate synthase
MPLPLGEHRARILEYLRAIELPRPCVARTIVEECSPDATLLRPMLVVWAGSACGGDVADLVPVAAAFDLFDRFLRLHDELIERPAQADPNSAVARWGLGQSLNAGDTFYALALRALAQDVVIPQRRLEAASLVTQAVLEAIEDRTRKGLRRRGAVLTGAALEAGALIAGAERARRQFNVAGRLLDAAADSPESRRAQAARARAIAAIERCAPSAEQLESFKEIVRYVALQAA